MSIPDQVGVSQLGADGWALQTAKLSHFIDGVFNR